VAAFPLIVAACPHLTAGDLDGCTSAIGTNQCALDTAAGCKNVRDCMNP
jgi:hypothetical protein